MPDRHVDCDTCGADDCNVVFQSTLKQSLDQSNFTVLGELGEYPQIVRCNVCHLTYASPRDDAGALDEKYKDMSVTEYLAEEESRRLITEKDAEFASRYCPSGQVLDIGCSAGLFLSSLSDAYSKTGVEPSVRAAAEANKNVADGTIHNTTLNEADLSGRQFDLVTMWDVIEHMDSPQGTLRDVHNLVADAGHLILVTPDIGSLLARAMGKRWTHLIRGHLFYYTRKTLSDVLGRAGFEVVAVSSYARYFKLRYVLKRVGLIALEKSWTDRIKLLDITVPINFGDAMVVVARKIGPQG